MKVLEMKNIEREEGQIFYLRKYKGEAVLQFPTNTLNTKIQFTIETNPLGKKNIDLAILQAINYPLLPVRKAILEYIFTEELEGRLPC
ncbi:MAG: hypothetical protein GX677_07025 [Treponema sp.]|jgi:hypothetical protein|nr:hypothetical protein [Treponema sp.]